MGLFNFNKKKKFLSKLSTDQRDEIIITLILMKQMIDADGLEKDEEKEYLKKYLINCGISSKDELESILDRAGNLTTDEYDTILDDFDEFQKLTILQKLYGIICSDDEIDENELGLLFQISRDMKIEDDIVMDMLGAKKDLLEEYFKKNDLIEDEKNKSKNNRVKNFNNVNEFLEASKLVDTSRLIDLYKIASKTSDSENGNTDFKIKLYSQIINEIPLLNNQSGGVVYTSEDEDGNRHEFKNVKEIIDLIKSNPNLKIIIEVSTMWQGSYKIDEGKTQQGFYHLWANATVKNDNLLNELNEFLEDDDFDQNNDVHEFLCEYWDLSQIPSAAIASFEHTNFVEGKGTSVGTDDISWSSEDYVRESEYNLYALKNSIDKPSSPNDEGGVKYALEDLNDPLLEISDSDMGLHQIFLEEIYFNRAQAFKKLENLNEAEKDYQKAIDVNPGRNDATFYHYLGCAKFQLKRPIGDILNCFDNSIKYNKNDDAFSLRLSDTYYMRAAARLSDEKFSDAKKDIEKAFELDPKDDAIHRLKNEIEDILKNTSQNNNNKVESVTDIKKTDKFCSNCGEHFNGEEKFCTSCGNKRNIVELDDWWLGSESDLIVESNKEFKSAINNIDVENLDSFSVDIILSKWSTYEEVTYDGDFECYGYELTGGIANKWTKHLGCYTNNLVGFLNDVGDNDLHQLDSNLKYDSTNFEEEPDYTFIEKINWNEGTPKKIKKEIEENYSSNDYEKLISKTNPNESFGNIEFFNKEQSNLFQIIVKYDQGGVEKSIIWSDTEHEEGKCRECKCEVKSHLRFCESCEAKRSKTLDNIDKSLAYLEKKSSEKEANGTYNKNLESDKEERRKIINEALELKEKFLNNQLQIKISQGENHLCKFQFNEEFKNYGETDEFKKHSALYGDEDSFDYTDYKPNSDIETFVSNPNSYNNLKTYSGWLLICQVFKIPKEDLINYIDEFITSFNDYNEYDSLEDYLEGEIEWDSIYRQPLSEYSLGYNGPKLKQCLIGFYSEETKGFDYIVELDDGELKDKVETDQENKQ